MEYFAYEEHWKPVFKMKAIHSTCFEKASVIILNSKESNSLQESMSVVSLLSLLPF